MSDTPRWRRADIARGTKLEVVVDNTTVSPHVGETVATAMLAEGAEFEHDRDGQRRAPFCNMGTCFECTATIDGRSLTRTCLTEVANDMHITTTRRK